MKKHQFVKADCNCQRRATFFTCKYCGTIEHCSSEEIRALDAYRATCTDHNAPDAPPAEVFKSKMGGGLDCLAPDYETWARDHKKEMQPASEQH